MAPELSGVARAKMARPARAGVGGCHLGGFRKRSALKAGPPGKRGGMWCSFLCGVTFHALLVASVLPVLTADHA